MALKSLSFTAVLLLAIGNALFAEDLDINNFKEVKNQKEIPAKIVYIKADGSEGQKEDAGVVPVVKMELSQMPKTDFVGIELMAQIDHLVRPDVSTTIATKKGSIGVDVWASPDFKRAPNNDPNGKVEPGDFNGHLMFPPDMDFWIISPQHTFFSSLDTGKWTHVEGKFNNANAAYFEFHVPPGTGFVYLKNFVSKP